jgi:predicted transcriptional regulator
MPNSDTSSSDKTSLSADIVAAYVSHNAVAPAGLPALIESVHSAITSLGVVEAIPKTEALIPAVPIRKSITPGFLICLDDGKKLPMTAPDYAATRSALAKSIGLGQLRKATAKTKPGRTFKAEAEKAAS